MNKKHPVPDKNEQILRAIAMKRESYFQLILANLLRNESVTSPGCCANEDGNLVESAFDFNKVVDVALKTADHAIELLYPIKPAE
jgi:hypothetical protein